jgi:hypothetical protein
MVCETASAVSILSVSPRQATFLSRRACYRLLITSINTAGGGDELNRPLGGVAPAPGPAATSVRRSERLRRGRGSRANQSDVGGAITRVKRVEEKSNMCGRLGNNTLEVLMRRWTRRGLVRISKYWFVMVSFAVGVAATVVLHNWFWSPHQTNPSFSGSEIDLQIVPKGTRLLVQWNPQSLAVLQGYSGLLMVQDGGRQVRVPLDRQQLRAGNTSYTPTNEWAEFRLEIYRDGNHYSGEAMALATGLKAKDAVPADTPLVQAVPRPRGSTSQFAPGVETRQLREFAPPTLFAATNTSTSAILEESPPNINPARNKTALNFFLDDPEHPSPKAGNGLLQDVLRPNSEPIPLPVSATSPDRSERLGTRSSRGSTISPGVESPQLREFSRPPLSAATNSSAPATVEEIPASIKPAQNSTAVIFPTVDSKHPSPVSEVPLPRSEVGKLTIRTYDGTILDAACDTLTEVRVPNEHQYCAVSAATAMFAIRLGDGQTLQFDSVGNLRAQNAKIKNQWVAKTIAGKKIHATVTGVIAGKDLIVLSVE